MFDENLYLKLFNEDQFGKNLLSKLKTKLGNSIQFSTEEKVNSVSFFGENPKNQIRINCSLENGKRAYTVFFLEKINKDKDEADPRKMKFELKEVFGVEEIKEEDSVSFSDDLQKENNSDSFSLSEKDVLELLPKMLTFLESN